MERRVLLWLVAGLVHQAIGYNLNLKEPHVIVQADDKASLDRHESLFGWSVENFKGTMFVGAPRGWSSQYNNETGKVYRCTHERNSNNKCVNIPTDGPQSSGGRDTRNVVYGWYGASLAAGKDKMYTCAPFRGTVNWWSGKTGLQLSKSRVLGNCLKYEEPRPRTHDGQFSRCTEFRHSYPFQGNNFNQHWAQRGSYGLAAVVDAGDDIVVGAPLATAFQDWSGTSGDRRYSFGQDYHSGAIVKYKKEFNQNKQFWPKVSESQFVILNTEGRGYSTEMLNHYKMAGMAIDKAKMYDESTSRATSAVYSYVIGAPKADNNLGKVYVCSKCFDDNIRGRSNFYFPEGNFEVKPSPENRQIGEKFGSSLAACDVNGDGHDDVIVGAPFYSDNQHDSFNIGRVHVFVKAARGVKKGLPETLMPNNLPRGSRFGTALACLGDTNGDMYQEVVVGAPYYNYDKYGAQGRTSGVIFIYQGYHLGLKKDYSQKITAVDVGPQLKGFGISFSKRGSVDCSDTSELRVPDCSQCPTNPRMCSGDCVMKCLGGDCFDEKTYCVPKSANFDTHTGLSIGAHLSNQAVYMQFRKVPRFQDVSKIEHPNSIAPETTKIAVSFKPRISTHLYDSADRTATLDVRLNAEVEVLMDFAQKRMSGAHTQSAQLSISAGTTEAAAKTFTFNVDRNKLGMNKDGERIPRPDPIPVIVTVKWTLPSCNTPICPMFDPNEAKGAGGTVIETRKRQNIIVKSGCDDDVCQCDIKMSVNDIIKSMIAGEHRQEKVFNIVLDNKGREPAFETRVSITIDDPAAATNNTDVINAGGYYITKLENKNTFKFEVPFIQSHASVTIPVTIRTVDISARTKTLKLSVDAIPECTNKGKQNQRADIAVKHQWNVLAKPLYPNEVEVDKFNWDWRNEDKQWKITQTFQIKNEGPSPSGPTEFYVFIPKSSSLLSGHRVDLDGDSSVKCNAHFETVPSDIQTRSCGLSGDCVSKKCSVPAGIKKDEHFNLEVSVMFNLEAAKKLEKRSFNVITSVRIVDHQNERTTTFWKTTLEYSGQSIIQQIFNNMYVVAGVVVGLIFLTIISIILYKCNVFSNVRIYKDKIEERSGMELEKTGDPKA